ncbi:hypothetical protein [Fibrobacter sp. UWB12]|uniref:hypothetical protein n=1 Tax=Fibrobacter sp. UWB12 TaxID=1896203 RepID=UPI0009203F92|nr:hypothetical protein [Fibrobacter sp. UWB12]SHK54236.1 hypothetical protein SAMN05720759_103347 [Fibrobacter sp. UWB12]
MNKKIYAGMITFGVAASFWACGSGEILKPDELTDKNALVIAALEDQEPTKLTEMVNLRVLDTLCPDCLKGTASSSSRAIPTPRSSSSRNPFVNSSSSSQLIINSATSSSTPPVYESSSSYNPNPVPVYSSSSSTPVVVGEDIGTCGPETPTVESGAKVIWVFKNGKDFPGNMMLNSDFTWTTSDANVPTATIGGYKGRIDTVTYAASGKHNASVSVFVKTSGATYNISCTPVQVNGAPITGCKCTAADKKPDVSVGGSWTVTGCTSAGAEITGYEWLGAVGDGPTATQAFTKKNQMAAPVVNVSNNDNTVQPVQCDEVVSVDATDPDYILTEQNTKIELPKGESTLVLDLPSGWHGGANTGTCTLRCDDAGGPVTITVGTQSSKADYSATLSIPVENTMNKSAIVVGLDLAAKCQIAY